MCQKVKKNMQMIHATAASHPPCRAIQRFSAYLTLCGDGRSRTPDFIKIKFRAILHFQLARFIQSGLQCGGGCWAVCCSRPEHWHLFCCCSRGIDPPEFGVAPANERYVFSSFTVKRSNLDQFFLVRVVTYDPLRSSLGLPCDRIREKCRKNAKKICNSDQIKKVVQPASQLAVQLYK